MTTEPELDKLIIDNLADLDATAKRADLLVNEIWAEAFATLQSWASNHGWQASQDPDEEDAWVAPPEWADGDGDYLVWFQVDWGPGDTGVGGEGQTYFDLSRFAGVGGGRLCLWLRCDGVKRSFWKPALREAASQGGVGGFLFDSTDGLYLDCTPAPGSLAAAVADDDYAVAFEPLIRALDAAHEHWQIFDQLLNKPRAA